MNENHSADAAPAGIVGSVGRAEIELALVDLHGKLRPDTIRKFTPAQEPMVSGAIIRFARDAAVSSPYNVALAVAGVVRGDAVPITNSTWIVSRSGLTAMLRRPPVLVNDFAAKAWALAGEHGVALRPFASIPLPLFGNGTRCLIGIGEELGVAAFILDGGHTVVLASEAGASALPHGSQARAELIEAKVTGERRVQTDAILSAPGLFSVYSAICARAGAIPRAKDGHAVARSGADGAGDSRTVLAVEVFCDALLSFASDLVLIYGAWDGVYFSGSIIDAVAKPLAWAIERGGLCPRGPHARRLSKVPLGLASFENGELSGAAIALASAAKLQ